MPTPLPQTSINKAMTPQERLKPRYKVIADYPGSNYPVGLIMEQTNNEGVSLSITLNDYPHLFKELQWFEDREPEDMPEYVKGEKETVADGIWTVSKWKLNDGLPRVFCDNIKRVFPVSLILPATESEYNQYIQSLTIKQ